MREDREQNKGIVSSGGGGGSGGGHHHHGHGGQFGGGGGGGWNRVGGGGGGRNNHHQWGNTSVYVGNLAYETTWQELKDHMRRVGNIDKVNNYMHAFFSAKLIVINPTISHSRTFHIQSLFSLSLTLSFITKADILQGNDGRSKGCGIVIYQNPKEAQRAIRELQNSELNGRPIFVREDRESSGGGGGGGGGGGFGHRNNIRTSANLMPGTPSEQGCQLYVGNLSWGTTWRELKHYFKQCGEVDRAEVAEGPDGTKRGFGLIRFHRAGDAREAIERLDGAEFMGRVLEVRLDNKV